MDLVHNTDEILQAGPFYLHDISGRNQFMQIAKALDLTLDPFLLGRVYKSECQDDPTPYTEKQLCMLEADILNVYKFIFRDKFHTEDGIKAYTYTCGASGSGKSTFLEIEARSVDAVYIDPDRSVLLNMHSYAILAVHNAKLAYETYRDASNYIANLLLVWAVYKGYSIVHGTTGTNPRVCKSLLPTLKELGYRINAHVFFSAAKTRADSIDRRNRLADCYQSTPADQKDKTALVYSRIIDSVIPFAASAVFYWNDGSYVRLEHGLYKCGSLRKFAELRFDRGYRRVHGLDELTDILDELLKEVENEISEPKLKQEVITMFKSWRPQNAESRSRFLPMYAIAVAGAALATGAAYAFKNTPS